MQKRTIEEEIEYVNQTHMSDNGFYELFNEIYDQEKLNHNPIWIGLYMFYIGVMRGKRIERTRKIKGGA